MKTLEINPANLFNFIKMLIESSGVYEVQNDYTVINKDTGDHITIKRGAEEKTLVIFHENMPVGNYAIWVPFKESIGIQKEKEWFFGVLTSTPGVLLKMMMMKLVSDVANKTDKNYNQFDLMSKLVDKCDKTMIDELDKIGSNDYISVHYNKSKKTAVAETMLFSDEIKEKYPKFRKKTWDVIHTIFVEIFGVDETKDHTLADSYKWMAKILDIPETEAKIKVCVALLDAMAPYTKSFLNIEMDVDSMKQHCELLEGYSKIYAYASTAQTSAPTQQGQVQAVPWKVQSASPYQQAIGQGNPYQNAMPIAPTVPQMPVYGQPQTTGVVASSDGAIPMSQWRGRYSEPVANNVTGPIAPPPPVFGMMPQPQVPIFGQTPQPAFGGVFGNPFQNAIPVTANPFNTTFK